MSTCAFSCYNTIHDSGVIQGKMPQYNVRAYLNIRFNFLKGILYQHSNYKVVFLLRCYHMKKLSYFKNQDQERNNKHVYPESYRQLFLPANGSFTEYKERSVLAQRQAIRKLKIPKQNTGFFCIRIVFQDPTTIVRRENQLHKVSETSTM